MIELSCLHGSERYAACFDEVVARAVRVSQPAVLSALLAIQLFGVVIPPPYFPKEHQKERCGHFSAAALLHYFSWCALEYSVAGRISCHVPYDNIETNVCQRSFADFFFANCKCKLDTRMDKKCSAEAGLGCLAASTAGAVKDAAGKAEPVP